jgi:hypothetical protein
MTVTSSDTSRRLERIFSVLLVFAICAFVVAVGAYAYSFAGAGGYAFSKNVEDWVHFAEYLGGTLGPIYGLFAFLGVLITILLQGRQIDDMRAQSTQQALQNLLASVSANIDVVLRGPPVIKPSDAFDEVRTRYEVVSEDFYLERYTIIVGYIVALKFEVSEEVTYLFDLAECKVRVLHHARKALAGSSEDEG